MASINLPLRPLIYNRRPIFNVKVPGFNISKQSGKLDLAAYDLAKDV